MREIPGPCELGDTRGPELRPGRILDFLDKYKGYLIFLVFLGWR